MAGDRAGFLEAKKSIKKLEVYTNTVLGETWKPVEQIQYEDLSWKLDVYPAQVPPGVLVLTAAADVQKDRIECEVVGWGKDHECWSIAYKVFFGSPGIEVTPGEDDDAGDDAEPLSDVWTQLSDFLMTSFVGANGRAFRVQCAAIDSGYLSRIVYKFCKKYANKRWFAVKGSNNPFQPLLTKSMSGQKPKVRLFTVGTNAAKDEVFAALKVLQPGPGYCHFPDVSPYNEDAHMKQLASEKMVTHTRSNRTYRVYEKVGANVRNEALDIRVYNVAARTILDPNYEAIAKRHLQHGEPADRESEPPASAGGQNDGHEPPPTPPPAPKQNVVPFKKGGSLTKNNPFSGYKP